MPPAREGLVLARDPQPPGVPTFITLAIASASSVVAALLVAHVWGPGTVVGAAATPVVITLVAELLTRPARGLELVGAPLASGRSPERARSAILEQGALTAPHRYRSVRRPIAIALGVGLAAFAIGAVVLTSTELLFGSSSVGSSSRRTTVFGGDTGGRSPRPARGPTVTTTPTTTSPATPTPTTSTKSAPTRTAAPPATTPLGPTQSTPPPPTGATTG